MNSTTTSYRYRSLTVTLLALTFAAAACGSSDAADQQADDLTSTTLPQESAPATQSDGSPVVTARPDGESGSTTPEETTSTTTTTTEATTTSTEPANEQAGEPFDFGMAEGSKLSVIGVAWDDDLNFRAGPGTSNPVFTAVESIDTDHDIIALGEAWQIDNAIWWKVTVDGTEAWASQRFLAAPGLNDNVFDEVAEGLGVLKAETLESLAQAVADTRPAGGPTPRVVIVSEPLVFPGSGATVTIDLLDLGDDALVGERLRITTALIMSDGDEPTVEAFVLIDVTRTILCGRGVQEGLCL